MKTFSTIVVGIMSSVVIPGSVFAQSVANQGVKKGEESILNIRTLLDSITENILGALGTLLLALAVVAFFWGVVEYVWASRAGKPEQIKQSNIFLKWSLLALFVMFSLYGIIKYGQDLFGIRDSVRDIVIPEILFKRGSSGGSVPGGTNNNSNGGAVSGGANSSGGANPLGGGSGSSKKGLGYSCTNHSQCASGFCDPADGTCSAPSQGSGKAGLGYSCTDHSQCASGFCDPADGTCSAPSQGSGKAGLGYHCTNDSQCASGFCDPADSTCSQRSSSGGGSGSYALCTAMATLDECSQAGCSWNENEDKCYP